FRSLFKVSGQVAALVATAELDDRDALALAIQGGGVIVEFCHLCGQVRHALLRAVPRASLLMNWAHVGLGLGTVIETEHTLDDVLQVGGNLDGAGAPAVGAAGVIVHLQSYTE